MLLFLFLQAEEMTSNRMVAFLELGASLLQFFSMYSSILSHWVRKDLDCEGLEKSPMFLCPTNTDFQTQLLKYWKQVNRAITKLLIMVMQLSQPITALRLFFNWNREMISSCILSALGPTLPMPIKLWFWIENYISGKHCASPDCFSLDSFPNSEWRVDLFPSNVKYLDWDDTVLMKFPRKYYYSNSTIVYFGLTI